MLNQLIWWGCITLEVFVVARGIWGRLGFRYPAFYCYVSFVLFQDLLSFLIYRWDRPLYAYTYWTTEFVGVIVGCGIVFEIYRKGLAAYPGTARMARNALAVVFALALAKALVNAANDPRWWLEATARAAEATLRAVQALSIVVLVLLFLFYAIPFGKNLRGILLGYGLFISASILSLTLTSAGVKPAADFWAYAFPVSYLVALSLWTAHLWSYSPNPAPKVTVRLEQEYLQLAAATQRRLQGARGYLAKAVRS